MTVFKESFAGKKKDLDIHMIGERCVLSLDDVFACSFINIDIPNIRCILKSWSIVVC